MRLADCVLPIVSSQFPGFKPSDLRSVKRKVQQLEQMGFRVIRVPRIGGDPKIGIPWSGISYVNALLVDHQLFLPRFRLGQVEATIFRTLEVSLPASYSVIPVYARQALVHNGGLHCTVAVGRWPSLALPAGAPTD